MSELKVTFDLDPDTKATLNTAVCLITEILGHLNAKPSAEWMNQHPVDAVPPATEEDVVKKTSKKKTAEPKKEPEETAEQPVPKEEPKKAEEPPKPKEVSLEDLQSVVADLIRLGKRAEAKAVINEYAPRVSGIAADKRAEVLEKLEALK